MKHELFALGLGSILLLASCGKEEPKPQAEIEAEASETAAEITEEVTEEVAESDFGDVIDAREKGMKTIAASFKTIRESDDIEAVKEAAATMDELASDVGMWFPAGSGPGAGVETDALAAIWTEPVEFTAAVAKLKAATTSASAAAQTGELAAVKATIPAIGGSCKGCHDAFKAED